MPNHKFKETYGAQLSQKPTSKKDLKEPRSKASAFNPQGKVIREVKLPELALRWLKRILVAGVLIAIILAGGVFMMVALVLFIVGSLIRRIFFPSQTSAHIIRRKF